jgi:two-component system, OmpR family, sensor histidine kinase BaeS
MGRGARAPIALRMALAFVAMALLAVGIVLALAVALGGRDINAMIQERRADLTATLGTNAAATYNTGRPGWSDVDLQPALALAARSGTNAAVLDDDGHVVASTITDPSHVPNAQRSPIMIADHRIGTLVVSFNGRGLVASADRLRTSLDRAFVGAAGLAALLALVVALIVARRLAVPITRLTVAARTMSQGDRAVRVGRMPRAPREVNELAVAFDGMADAVARQEQLRRDLVSDTAHELRTPVAILQANCEALLDAVVPHTAEQTASLHEEVLRLAGLVDDLQSLASADAAAQELHAVPCDLALLVDVALDSLSSSLAAADLTVTRHLEPALVDGDPVRLHQAVTNVLTNAQKFTPAGGRVDVALSTAEGVATLRITDTGIGIPEPDRDQIFERFWRGSNSDKAPGTGIGLAVVAQLVGAHGGTVAVDSKVGVGTTITLEFPLAAATVA